MMGIFGSLRVIDVSPNRVGAQISQIFADFGADVIQVEPPGGAEIRHHAAYPFWARAKRSIVLDLHVDADRDVLRSLARHADVFIETHRPGRLDALDLGHDALLALNPRLVYTSVTGWGRTNPYRDVAGYEGVIAARVGLFQNFRPMNPRDAPAFVTVPFMSFAASQIAIQGIFAALYERERSGAGQWVETNLLHAFTSLDTWAWAQHLIADRWPDAFFKMRPYDDHGNPASPLTFMLLQALTKDGRWLQFASVAPHLYAALMKALGLDWMFTDPDWQGLPLFGDDAAKRSELWARMLDAARQKTIADWEAIFDADPNVFAEQFRNGPEVLEHPQLLHDGFTVEVDDADHGRVRQPAAIVKATGTPAEVGRSAPRLDADRDAVLALAASEPPPAREMATTAGLPFQGVTILELATLFACPHGTTMLTDLGARVYKIEPLEGDRIRVIMPFPESGGLKVMQGKESIAVDLTTDEGRAIVRALAAKADVVVQGYRAGAMAKLGLDYASIVAGNPDVIYVNAPGYGVDGPYGAKPAYAPSIGAATGVPLVNAGDTVEERADLELPQVKEYGRRLSAACMTQNAQSDGFAALGVATAIAFGLTARAFGAGGQELFSSMLNTGAHAMSAHVVTYPGAPTEVGPDRDLRGFGPLYRMYETADGWVFVAAPDDREWVPLAIGLGQPGLAGDARFSSQAARAEHHHELADALQTLFVTRSAVEWEETLVPQGVACVAVATTSIEDVLFDEAFGRASGMVVDVVHPTFEEHPRLAPYVQFSRSLTQALPGVLCGQHTDAILAELGYGPERIADLRGRKVVA
jgi:crotonobetainyl-CoA:carnitine CoA-transferase CaiB-like acyl-CoA transferase